MTAVAVALGLLVVALLAFIAGQRIDARSRGPRQGPPVALDPAQKQQLEETITGLRAASEQLHAVMTERVATVTAERNAATRHLDLLDAVLDEWQAKGDERPRMSYRMLAATIAARVGRTDRSKA